MVGGGAACRAWGGSRPRPRAGLKRAPGALDLRLEQHHQASGSVQRRFELHSLQGQRHAFHPASEAAHQKLKTFEPRLEPKWFSFLAQCVTNTLQSLLLECGLSVEEASRFTTHSFRRGAGVDVLEAESTTCSFLAADHWRRTGMYGLPGMLRMGEWASKASSTHHATADEQSRAGMAFNILEASEDER